MQRSAIGFIWDTTHRCPLQCLYCYSESGPSKGPKTTRAQLQRVAQAIARERPGVVMLSGGEPAHVPGIDEVGRFFRARGILTKLYTSGWKLDQRRLDRLVDAVDIFHVSLDAIDPAINDRVRGRVGAAREALRALGVLNDTARARRANGERLPRFGVDCTLLRSNFDALPTLCRELTRRFEQLDFIFVNAAVPSGRGSRDAIVARELLSAEQRAQVGEALFARLRAHVPAHVVVAGTDNAGLQDRAPSQIYQLDPDGALRAVNICKHTVGNLCDEPLATLVARARAWKDDSPLVSRLRAADGYDAWGAAVRDINDGAARARVSLPVVRAAG